MHSRDPKHKIYVFFFSFWGLRPPDPNRGSASGPPQLPPPTSDSWRRHCM